MDPNSCCISEASDEGSEAEELLVSRHLAQPGSVNGPFFSAFFFFFFAICRCVLRRVVFGLVWEKWMVFFDHRWMRGFGEFLVRKLASSSLVFASWFL